MKSLSLIPFDLVGFIGPFPNHDPLNSDRMRDFDSETPFVFDSLIPLYRKKLASKACLFHVERGDNEISLRSNEK